MRKVLNIFVLILVVSLMVGTVAYAVETRAAKVSVNLSFSGTTANCNCTVTDINKTIDVTLELYDGSTRVGSWTAHGTGYASINECCSVTKGKSYTLTASGTIDGVPFSGYSVSKVCP